MTDLEDLVRKTFIAREQSVSPPVGLAAAARQTAARQRRRVAVISGSVVVLALVASTLGLAALRPPTEVVPSTDGTSADPDWQWMSSSGIEAQIPSTWTINDGCLNTLGEASIGPRRACDLSKSGPRAYIQIGGSANEQTSPKHVVIDGHDATIETVLRPDGRTRETIHFVDTPIVVTVELTDTDLLNRITTGIRFVDVDHAGCPTGTPPSVTQRPEARRAGTAETIIPSTPSTPSEIALCAYGSATLRASTVVSGAQASELRAALAAAPTGPNPDERERCSTATGSPLVLLAQYDDGPPVTVHVWYTGCVDRRADNGARVVHVTRATMTASLRALSTGASYGEDIK